MTRLIDADALNKKLCETTIFIKDGEKFQRMINDAPTIELDGDLISRQDAVKEIDSFCGEVWTESEADFARGLGAALSIVESLPSAEQVTGKLNNPDDSLLTADSEACKEQKSKLDLISRQDAIAEFQDGRDVYDIMESIEELPSAPDSRQRETNKEIAERIIGNTCKNRVFCELYPDACQKEKCDIYLVINTFLNTPDIDTPSRQRGEWVGCTGCEHYDQQQTRLICHECKRYYSDKYKGGEDE